MPSTCPLTRVQYGELLDRVFVLKNQREPASLTQEERDVISAYDNAVPFEECFELMKKVKSFTALSADERTKP